MNLKREVKFSDGKISLISCTLELLEMVVPSAVVTIIIIIIIEISCAS